MQFLQKILQLDPSTFVFKSDKSNTKQIGLIAEEVAEVLPDLVVFDGSGKQELPNPLQASHFLTPSGLPINRRDRLDAIPAAL